MFESTGITFNVQPFSSDLGVAKDFPIFDGALECYCPYTGEVYLVIKNALHVPSMDYNLIPPFMMRCGSVIINDFPNTHCEHPMVDDHSVSFDQSNL